MCKGRMYFMREFILLLCWIHGWVARAFFSPLVFLTSASERIIRNTHCTYVCECSVTILLCACILCVAFDHASMNKSKGILERNTMISSKVNKSCMNRWHVFSIRRAPHAYHIVVHKRSRIDYKRFGINRFAISEVVGEDIEFFYLWFWLQNRHYQCAKNINMCIQNDDVNVST